MSTGMEFDTVAARRLEKVYLTPDVVAQRGAVLEAAHLEQDSARSPRSSKLSLHGRSSKMDLILSKEKTLARLSHPFYSAIKQPSRTTLTSSPRPATLT